MKNKFAFFSVLLSSLIFSPLAGSQITINHQRLPDIHSIKHIVNSEQDSSLNQDNLTKINQSQEDMNIININLIAQEAIRPPLGVIPQTNRDIGFATVFLQLENPQQTNLNIFLKNIEIRNVSDRQLQAFHFSPQEIQLKPLENSTIDIHLANKIGYVGKDLVKAIVTYQIGKQVNTIESEAVEVDLH